MAALKLLPSGEHDENNAPPPPPPLSILRSPCFGDDVEDQEQREEIGERIHVVYKFLSTTIPMHQKYNITYIPSIKEYMRALGV